MFSLGEIGEQLKDVSRKTVGVSFAGQSLVLDTANDGKTYNLFNDLSLRVSHTKQTIVAQLSLIRS